MAGCQQNTTTVTTVNAGTVCGASRPSSLRLKLYKNKSCVCEHPLFRAGPLLKIKELTTVVRSLLRCPGICLFTSELDVVILSVVFIHEQL